MSVLVEHETDLLSHSVSSELLLSDCTLCAYISSAQISSQHATIPLQHNPLSYLQRGKGEKLWQIRFMSSTKETMLSWEVWKVLSLLLIYILYKFTSVNYCFTSYMNITRTSNKMKFGNISKLSR